MIMKRNNKRVFFSIVNRCCAVPHKRLSLKTKISDLTLDSLSFVTLIVELENEFNIEFNDDSLILQKYVNLGTLYEEVGKSAEAQ